MIIVECGNCGGHNGQHQPGCVAENVVLPKAVMDALRKNEGVQSEPAGVTTASPEQIQHEQQREIWLVNTRMNMFISATQAASQRLDQSKNEKLPSMAALVRDAEMLCQWVFGGEVPNGNVVSLVRPEKENE